MNFSGTKISLTIMLCMLSLLACRKPYTPDNQENHDQEKSKKLVEMNKALVRKDRLQIMGYISRNHLNMTETGTGLWYCITEKGDGPQVTKGTMVNLEYTISLTDGKICYDSKKDGL